MKKEIFKEKCVETAGRDGVKNFFSIEQRMSGDYYDSECPFHNHQFYELYYLKSGICTYTINNVRYDVKPGNLVFVAPGSDHKVVYEDENNESIIIYFTKNLISPIFNKKIDLIVSNPVYVPDEKSNVSVDNIVTYLMSEFENPDEYSYVVYKNMIFELMLCFIRRKIMLKEEMIPHTDMELDYVMNFIQANYTKNISLEELSEISGISTAHLSRSFKKYTGVNISDYIKSIRIEHAKTLLLETNESIVKISELCGFSDSTYFSRVFHNLENISPLKYRKMYS